MKTLVACILLGFAFSTTTAQTVEHYFRLTVQSDAEIDLLTRMVSVDNVSGKTVYGYANDAQWLALQKSGYAIEELPHPGSLYEHRMSESVPGITAEWDTYPTYDGYTASMQLYASTFPAICRLDTIGLSVQGRLILVMQITDNPDLEEDEPEFLYTSTMHGDETVGYLLTLRLIDYLLNQYGAPTIEGARVTSLVDGVEIWINPLSNPDGTYRGGNNTVTGAWRYNSRGVDLNRDFPDRISDPDSTTNGREAETAVMMNFVAAHSFTLSANFHGGAQVVNYPWDNGAPSGQYSMCPDDSWFIDVSRTYATPNLDIMNGGFANGITNGCDWYAIFGGRQDWVYYWYGGRETTIELYNTKNPPGSVLPERWNRNQESFLAYMEECLKGIRGVVTDAVTGEPVRATITVAQVSETPTFTDPGAGDYHHLLLPGTYDITVSADGYDPVIVQGIVVADGLATRVDIELGGMGQPPVVSDIPDRTTTLGGRFQAIRADNYVADPDNGDDELTWTWTGNVNLRLTWNATRRSITVRPPTGWTGSETIAFTITDPGGLSGSDEATYTVTSALALTEKGNGDGEAEPTSTTLLGNYPNPFNPRTDIRYQIRDYGWVKLEIFDLLGRKVTTLVNENLAPGSYTARWNAGSEASGIYLYRLSAGGLVETKRLILLR